MLSDCTVGALTSLQLHAERNHILYLVACVKLLLIWVTQYKHLLVTVDSKSVYQSAVTIFETLKTAWPNLRLPSLCYSEPPTATYSPTAIPTLVPFYSTPPPPASDPAYHPSEQDVIHDFNCDSSPSRDIPVPHLPDPSPPSPSSPPPAVPDIDMAAADAGPPPQAMEPEIGVDADLAKYSANPFRVKWNSATHKLPQFRPPSAQDVAVTITTVATMFFAELLAALDAFNINFEAVCWSHCFEYVPDFKQMLFVGIGRQFLSAARVLTLFRQHYLSQVRSSADADA